MKRRMAIASAATVAAVAVVFYAAPFQGTSAPLAAIFPGGPLVYLEAADFGQVLSDWNSSAEQQRWLASARYDAFSRSKLYLRLHDAWGEFSGAAGLVPDSALVRSIAGRESALAVYDIGNLEFLYCTRLGNSRAVGTALWQSRSKYDQRRAGNFDFFVRVESGQTVAFAVAGDYFILGTREETVAGALRLLSGEALASLANEPWYKDATGAAGRPGELRLVTNLEELVKSAQFRSYWIQRNVSEIRNYRAAVSDIRRGRGEIREERILLRKNATQPVSGNAEAILRLAPDDAAFSRAWVNPTAEEVLTSIERKLLAPKADAQRRYDSAPTAESPDVQAGSEQNLETRIDEPPLAAQSVISLGDFGRLLRATPLGSVLVAQSSETLPDGVFAVTPAVVVVQRTAPWDLAAVRSALTAAAASLWTTGNSGANWGEHRQNGHAVYALDGLAPLAVAVEGGLLFVGNSTSMLHSMLDRIGLPAPATEVTNIALFRHNAAREGYHGTMTLLDRAQPPGYGDQQPRFFSEDLWSLSEVFSRVALARLTVTDSGVSMRETLSYTLP